MKKKLVVLLMASSMALAACTSQPTVTPTAPVETEATTEAGDTTEAADESADAEETSEEAGETSDAAESTEAVAAGEGVEIAENSTLAMMIQGNEELVTVSVEGDKYLLNYDASMFEGQSVEDIEAAFAASFQGNEEAANMVTVNDDGSVVIKMTEEQFVPLNTPMDQLIAQ